MEFVRVVPAEGKPETCSTQRMAPLNLASMLLNDFLRDRQPRPRPSHSWVFLFESFKDQLMITIFDTWSRIVNLSAQFSSSVADRI